MKMRNPILAIAGALLCGACLLAQPPAAPQQPAPIPAELNGILQNWERVMNGINSLVADCTRKQIDKTWATTKVYEGTAKFLKPNMARLKLTNKADAKDFEEYVCSGAESCVYYPQAKVIRLYKLTAPEAGQAQDDSLLTFLMGMKAAEAVKRFELTLLPATPETEKWYYYIRVLPRDPKDRANFTQARLVLLKSSHLPAQVWFEQPNGNEVYWDFTKLYTGVQLQPQEFQRPTPPPGWQLVPADLPGAPSSGPRVIRPQN
jgi:TIGR03009 family protein